MVAAKQTGRALWDRAFGSNKEEGSASPRQAQYSARSLAEENAVKRLLGALRSKAPGGWTDDRWEQSRRFTDIAYVGIHRQNELLTQCEFQVFREAPDDPEGKRPVDRKEPAYELVKLLKRPNDEDSFGDLVSQWNLQLDLTGTALTWVVPNALGKPRELYSIPTATAVPQPIVTPQHPQGCYRIQPYYPYGPFTAFGTPMSAAGSLIPTEWMMRIKFPHPLLRYEGWSPLTALNNHLDSIKMIDRSRTASMRGVVKPSAVLNMEGMEDTQPLPHDEIDRIRAEFASEHQGADNLAKLICSFPGAKIEPWGATPDVMMYESGWEQLVSFALGGLGITKPAAGMIEDSSYSTLFATLKQLYWLTLDPKCTRIANRLTRFLCPHFGDDLFVEVRCRRIDDHEVKGQTLDRLITGKAITKNELRRESEMPTTQDEWGEDIAGDPSPKEQEQQEAQAAAAPGVPGQPGGDGGEKPPEKLRPADADMEGADEAAASEREEPKEIGASRPKTGTLGRGALGPRMKAIRRVNVKALRAKYLTNGFAHAT